MASGTDDTIVGDTSSRSATFERELPRGAVIGRYVVLAKLSPAALGAAVSSGQSGAEAEVV